MNKLILIILPLCLVGCDREPQQYDDITNYYNLPPGMEDCRVYSLSLYVTVVNCPNSTTSTSQRHGKVTRNTIVINGETYVKEENDNTIPK